MAEAPKKKKLSRAEASKLIPSLKEFNKLSKSLIGLLNSKLTAKEEHVKKIKVMVDGFVVPQRAHNISIKTIGMASTTVKKKGEYSFLQKMDWEKDYRKRKKGMIL